MRHCEKKKRKEGEKGRSQIFTKDTPSSRARDPPQHLAVGGRAANEITSSVATGCYGKMGPESILVRDG